MSGILSGADWATFNGKSNTTGTVTSVATDGTALTGGPFSTTGTITHTTTTGYKHIPSGGASGNVLTWASDGTASWAASAVTYTHPTGDGNLHVIATSTTNSGKFLMAGATAGALSWGTPTDTNTWIANALNTAGYVAAPAAGNANQVWKCDASGNPAWRADADTWTANSLNVAGYVAAPAAGNANQVWKLDALGNPAWRAEVDNYVGTVTSVAAGTAMSFTTFYTTGTINHATGSTYNHLPGSGAAGKILGWATGDAGTWVDQYAHPTGDGNLHVPATLTTNNGKLLIAGATAGAISWSALPTITFSDTGGAAIGATFDGGTARTISYVTVLSLIHI